MSIALASFPVFLALLALRVPVALSMLLVGGTGYLLLSGWTPLIASLKTGPYFQFSSYSLTVIPFFLLMGQFAAKAGMSRALFDAAKAWLGHRRGGLAMAAIGSCAGFGAICGSSLATAATMGQAALPELRRHGYSGALATGALAAGGTLGILIPPSLVLVVYAILTEQNIGALFLAALGPALLAVLGYIAAVWVFVRLDPAAGPAAERAPASERRRGLAAVAPVAAIFALVIGGIYLGWFTPTEGAAVGACATGLLALLSGGLSGPALADCLLETGRTTAMIFLILLGAELYNAFLALSGLPAEAARMIAESGLPPILVLATILLVYLLLGCVMDSLSMILLTVPIFFPIIMALDFGLSPDQTAIWFGILALVAVEVGLITPPVGLNVFVIHGQAPDVPLLQVFKGVLPFLAADIGRILLLLAFPSIALWALPAS